MVQLYARIMIQINMLSDIYLKVYVKICIIIRVINSVITVGVIMVNRLV